jgi:hypothetical protein
VTTIWIVGIVLLAGFWWTSAGGEEWASFSSRTLDLGAGVGISEGTAEIMVSSRDVSWSQSTWDGDFSEFDTAPSDGDPFANPKPSIYDTLAGDFDLHWGSIQGTPYKGEWLYMVLVPFWFLVLIFTAVCGFWYALARRRLIKRGNKVAQQGLG